MPPSGKLTRFECCASLGVARNAGDAEIRRAFLEQARIWHPDKCTAPDAAERFRVIRESFETLSASFSDSRCSSPRATPTPARSRASTASTGATTPSVPRPAKSGASAKAGASEDARRTHAGTPCTPFAVPRARKSSGGPASSPTPPPPPHASVPQPPDAIPFCSARLSKGGAVHGETTRPFAQDLFGIPRQKSDLPTNLFDFPAAPTNLFDVPAVVVRGGSVSGSVLPRPQRPSLRIVRDEQASHTVEDRMLSGRLLRRRREHEDMVVSEKRQRPFEAPAAPASAPAPATAPGPSRSSDVRNAAIKTPVKLRGRKVCSSSESSSPRSSSSSSSSSRGKSDSSYEPTNREAAGGVVRLRMAELHDSLAAQRLRAGGVEPVALALALAELEGLERKTPRNSVPIFCKVLEELAGDWWIRESPPHLAQRVSAIVAKWLARPGGRLRRVGLVG